MDFTKFISWTLGIFGTLIVGGVGFNVKAVVFDIPNVSARQTALEKKVDAYEGKIDRLIELSGEVKAEIRALKNDKLKGK